MIAAIMFNKRRQHVTLESLKAILNELGVSSTVGEWHYLTQVVPQLEVKTTPAIALQLNDRPYVGEENAELLEDDIAELSSEDRARVLECDARVEVVSGKQPHINHLPEGGIVSHTDEADISPAETQAILLNLTERLNGFFWSTT